VSGDLNWKVMLLDGLSDPSGRQDSADGDVVDDVRSVMFDVDLEGVDLEPVDLLVRQFVSFDAGVDHQTIPV
jgi:hypothetical protein